MVRGGLRCAAVVTLLAGCFMPTEPPLPDGIVPYDAPVQFARWWELVEACSGHTGNFASIRWYVVPDVRDFTVDGERYQGYTWQKGNRIVLAEASRLDGILVRHEMLHALIGGGHAARYFRERCGGIVVCDADCAREVGDPYSPPAATEWIRAEELELTMTTYPAVVSNSADSGWATIVVSATNPHPYPVWVRLEELTPGYGVSATFGFQEYYPDEDYGPGLPTYMYVLADRVAFRPGETRRYSFDFRPWLDGMRVCGMYNGRRTPLVPLRVEE